MEQAADAAEKIGVEIIGGHTEITDAVNKPVITATAIGRNICTGVSVRGASPGVQPGDCLIVTKKLAMEGTGIIVSERRDELAAILTEQEISESINMLDSVSVVADGLAAARAGASGMHDITEGGVLGAVWEMCELNGIGARIGEDTLPASDVTRKVCAHFGIDPFRLISSGSMLIAAPSESKQAVLSALKAAEIEAPVIGFTCEPSEGIRMLSGDEIEPPGSDEIYKV
jgi:hydrogenase expression/formation protein HypE